jgi:stage II sporulation protein D
MVKGKLTKEPEGVYITKNDGYLLYTYLYDNTEKFDAGEISAIGQDNEENSALTLGEVRTMLELLQEHYPVYAGEIEKIGETAFQQNHKDDSNILAEDFLTCYETLWQTLHPQLQLEEQTGILLGESTFVKNLDSQSVSENDMLLATQTEDNKASGLRLFHKTKLMETYQQTDETDFYEEHCYWLTNQTILFDLSAYRQENNPETEFYLEAGWISSNQPGALWITLEDYQICIQNNEEQVVLQNGEVYDRFEDIADLYFKNGSLAYLSVYDKKISGKLLTVSDTQIELEGMGIYTYRENLPVYKLYGQKEYYTKSDLKIGYDFTDFVLDEDGVIVAGLVTREEKMDTIRVVVKTTDFASAYHEQISFSCDSDFLINDEYHLAGEEVVIAMDDARFDNGRIYIRPETNLARTTITSIDRDQGKPSYRGNFEIAKTENGLLLINELLLEEYLYSVVPSEMPASYPMEALKAQAISARTYAYQRMLNSGLKEYGAHVDDSAAFQVYNNIKENENTTLAIRDTQGQIAAIGNELAETYYYSTSCGYGTDIGAWHSSSEKDYAYLVSRHISKMEGTDSETAENIADEETFRNYIENAHAEDYESEEGWYRWTYSTTLSLDRLNENLLKRYEASAKSVCVRGTDGNYVSQNPPVFTRINRLAIIKRGSGGVSDELLIEGQEGTVKVVGEHAIRSVLANENTQVIRQDGSTSTVSTLLPSAFCVLDVETDSDTNAVIAYTVTGGGYGHGIGMSQNGAKAMANAGMSCEEILQFFYEGISLTDMYELE